MPRIPTVLNLPALSGIARDAAALVRAKARDEGWHAVVRKIATAPARHGIGAIASFLRARYHASRPREYALYGAKAARPAAEILQPRVLLVAELSLAQCRKYRVTQKAEHFRSLGVTCTILDWGDRKSVRNALQMHPVVIFYRVPGYRDVLSLIDEAKRLGATTFWEVDDLIFDAAIYQANRNVHLLDPELKRGILFGIPLYRAALGRCDYGIASTETLAEAMRSAGSPEAFVIENALDPQTMNLAERVRAERPETGNTVTIVYGSGSKAHDADFQCAAPGLRRVLLERPEVRLRIVGHLTVPEEIAAFGERVERAPFASFESYLNQLGTADISIGPLEDTVFNDAKSNIKFLEASILGLPSVCSPRATFRQVIRPGVNGFLAETEAEWTETLTALVDDAGLRACIGRAACDTVQTHYAPQAVAKAQVAPLAARFLPPRRPALRVLVANVYYRPRTFGGATVVAEEVTSRLARDPGFEAIVFTSYGEAAALPYELFRYEANGIPVFAVKTPDGRARELEYVNPRMGEIFAEVLEAVRPDVVHMHSIQWLSASLADACRAAGIPYVITLHDAWWLCERQFMIDGKGKYCGQTEIDPAVCARCVSDSWFSSHRRRQLRRALEGAALLLSPSEFHRQLHIVNGIAPDKIRVNRNGIRFPGETRRRAVDPERIRFGFVGGIGPIKGIGLIRQALQGIRLSNYELLLVDNTLNVGHSSITARGWNLRGKVHVVPAYTQDTMDAFFESIDVLLFPSQWKESFGLTVREALARDVWVIVTESGGAVEDVVDGENGTVIPITDDPGPLQRAILGILEHPERLKGHVNRHKHRIANFETQAAELRQFLLEVCRPASVSRMGPGRGSESKNAPPDAAA